MHRQLKMSLTSSPLPYFIHLSFFCPIPRFFLGTSWPSWSPRPTRNFQLSQRSKRIHAHTHTRLFIITSCVCVVGAHCLLSAPFFSKDGFPRPSQTSLQNGRKFVRAAALILSLYCSLLDFLSTWFFYYCTSLSEFGLASSLFVRLH